ncbi:hypothetical protein PVAG01_07863 [Phlyctema vagabunda]|uniref:Gem-associated protein 5 TPR domain-containing protein n=1 Tax=Phlyctema vagabunda TaxID=108571 RepID=A0ABR4PDP5_9HELO
MSTGSGGQLARNRSLSMSSGGRSSKGRLATLAEVSMGNNGMVEPTRDFEPCAATASMLLYAQGNSVVCAHHDTLTIERRFSRHQAEVTILAVDTVSERGAGRLVVSYDAQMTAIVWDCLTGDEIARFASYDNLTVAAWMRNGNVAFGNDQGNVILFEPTTSEHISARTIDQIPITALAPAADCRTYAIGFANGSLLIAALQPRFTILHNLTTARGPSPIVTLAWHASSSRQKSDMLATQTNDGDLRVWSIAKSPTSTDPAKVVRVLKRSENYQTGPNWLGWSKNGRIVQYSEGETSSWDVRTKHVTYENVPTLGNVRGLAVYGPGATLFTLGRNNTAQQFDLNSPPVLVANVQHPANLLPPSPPVSIEEQKKGGKSAATEIDNSTVPINIDVSESDEDHMSPLARIAREMDKLDGQDERSEPDRTDTLSPVSSRSRASTNSRSSAGSRPHRKQSSVLSRGFSEGTTMSIGSSYHSHQLPSISSRDSLSVSSLSSQSYTSSSRSRPRGSRLRQEVLRSPEDNRVIDLFKFTKSRLSDIPYSHPKVLDNTHLTNDDLRRQMLSTIFGWDGEPHALVQDEMNRHPLGSPNRVLLAKWLGDIDTDIMATSSESMTSSDWMLLALSGIGGHASQTKVARAYVQRLLEKGDVHTAATIMIGMGDQNDAIEIYVSHKRFMEALILTTLVFPLDWQRQAELVRKWGEWAVQHSQQQLAIRCFSCTGSESSEPWTSPTAQAATFSQLQSQSIPEMLSPPLSPPGARGPQRSIAKTSALKLITTFGDKSGKSKFFGVGEDDRTPIGGNGVTPIAESALSPGGSETAHTAFLRPGPRSTYHTPASARTATPGGFGRHRLPSIGEMPSDVLPLKKPSTANLPAAADTANDKERSDRLARAHDRKSSQPETLQLSAATYTPGGPRAATASPMMQKNLRIANPLPSPSPESFTALKQDARTRNGSRDRKPDGLHIQWPPMESIITGDYMTSPGSSVTSSRATRHTTTRSIDTSRSIPASLATASTSGRSPTVAGSERSYRSLGVASSPVVTGRSLDQYISSLESAQYHAQKQRSRHASRERTESGRARSGSRKPKAREASEDRGRSNARYIKPAKRSPTSPVPMSPEDLHNLGAIGYGEDEFGHSSGGKKTRDGSTTREKASKASSRVRRVSPDRTVRTGGSKPASRAASRNGSRRPSPDTRLTVIDTRGRSKGREGSVLRSPSSPLPMSPQAKFYQADDDDDDYRKAYEEQKRFRSRNRSTSRLRERGTSAVRDPSPDRRRRDRSSSRQREQSKGRKDRSLQPPRESSRPTHTRAVSDQKVGDINQLALDRQLKKEQAARELEERRKSLARRPSVPPIVHPEELARLSPMQFRPTSMSPEFNRTSTFPGPSRQQMSPPPRSQTTSPQAIITDTAYLRETTHTSPQIGLPATPRAMRHPKYDPDGKDIPDVPSIPDKYDNASSWGGPPQGISYNTAFDSLAPLPKTTYQAAPRRLPPRSASAPIPEEPHSPNPLPAGLPTHPAFQAALPPSSRRNTQHAMRMSGMQSPRKITPGQSQPGELGYETRNNAPLYTAPGSPGMMGGIDETIEANSQPINPSNNNLTPPPPPPPPNPPLLRELQHLQSIPVPPAAPLYRPNHPNTNSIVSGVSQGSGVIEIVMDEDENIKPQAPELAPVQIHSRHASLSGPNGPPVSQHNRGRSFSERNDNSISGRFNRAAERLRSASRGKNGAMLERTRSPQDTSPYESVPPVWNQEGRSVSNTPGANTPNIGTGVDNGMTERHPREVKATMPDGIGMGGSYMMEGGMI